MTEPGAAWLGLHRVDDDLWRLPVTTGVISGASALFGGCATAAALVAARSLTSLPMVWAAAHFGAMARLGTEVEIRPRVVTAGKTVVHLEVMGSLEGAECFRVRAAAADRPPQAAEGSWLSPIEASKPEDGRPFGDPVHVGTL